VFKSYSFPDKYQEKIAQALRPLGFSLENPKPLADSVIRLSDQYQKDAKTTPWDQPEFMAAYLAYFFPLNYIRNCKVFAEMARFKEQLPFDDYVDFGFGLGSSLLAARDQGVVESKHSLHALDISSRPLDVYTEYFDPSPLRRQYVANKARRALGVFSYSLNELTQVPGWFFTLDTVVILEPSTSVWGRKLMAFRDKLKAEGYYLWAPCTHQKDCPLLIHSQRDWCHDRVHWQQPEWFSELETHLPMKNRTMTHSYLVASRHAPHDEDGVGRVVGDELKEKGKSRWLFCRGDQREFLSWLNKQGDPPSFHRGNRLVPEIGEVRGNELRLRSAVDR
jgi:hypothetical protein